MNPRPSSVARSALCVAGIFFAASAWSWPDKPIEIIVGFAADGGTDITARTLAPPSWQGAGWLGGITDPQPCRRPPWTATPGGAGPAACTAPSSTSQRALRTPPG